MAVTAAPSYPQQKCDIYYVKQARIKTSRFLWCKKIKNKIIKKKCDKREVGDPHEGEGHLDLGVISSLDLQCEL